MKQQRKKFVNNTRANNKREVDMIITSAYKMFKLISMMALRDEFHFGKSRLERFCDKLEDVLDSYERGYITLGDMKKTIEEETGIKVLQ